MVSSPSLNGFPLPYFIIDNHMPTLKIRTITNRELSCTYEEEYTVRMLKENIEHKEGMPVDQFKLIYMGQQMDEVKKLMDYKISAGSYIIMVPSLRGG